MTAYLLLGLTLLIAYLIGGVPFGWLVARGRGVDILRQGSGNIGATNVGRVLGRRFGALVFALDFAKGALPVLAASLLTPFAGGCCRPTPCRSRPAWPPSWATCSRSTSVSEAARAWPPASAS